MNEYYSVFGIRIFFMNEYYSVFGIRKFFMNEYIRYSVFGQIHYSVQLCLKVECRDQDWISLSLNVETETKWLRDSMLRQDLLIDVLKPKDKLEWKYHTKFQL